MDVANNFVRTDAVGIDECALQRATRDFEANGPQVGLRREFSIGELVDIEGKFGTDVAVRALVVGHASSVFPFQLGKLHRRRRVHGDGVADRVTDIMR
jgi:hypothetical protein